MNRFPRTWRRPKPTFWTDGSVTSMTYPITSRRIWWKPWTWKVTRYPHSNHFHTYYIRQPHEHR